ncbi:RimJ/RimL family protein N-acetyltransferase [Nakamurella sp. UYEF19]|uniref:GNAT family N-acetyltransferase n=1 Tax=Nakamurella sp. UYEF19 TaxID=1756392 RepID=UPI0033927C59
MKRQIVLVTDRLLVTTWLPGDIDDLCQVHSDPVTMRWVRHGRPETRDEVEDLIASYRNEQQNRGWTRWRVADRHDRLVGRAGFGLHHDGCGRELGFTLRRDSWGRGLATEVAGGLADWHWRNTAAELWAFAAVDNTASRRVLDKVGFRFEGDVEQKGVPCALYRLGYRPTTAER